MILPRAKHLPVQCVSRLAVILSLLSSCSPVQVDDPANIPQLGMWEDSGTVDSVTLDDVAVSENALPENIRKALAESRRSERSCQEPMMNDRVVFERLMNKRISGTCHIGDYDPSGAMMSVTARCEPQDVEDMKTESTAKIDATVDEDRVGIKLKAIIRMTEKSGSSSLLVISVRRTIRRLGDCGSA